MCSTKQRHTKTSSTEANQHTHYHMQEQHPGSTHNCAICESGRRGGVAARGAGSYSTSSSERATKAQPRLSLVVCDLEVDEDSDMDPDPVSPPLSPKTTTIVPKLHSRYRAATMHQDASMKRRSGWKPSLKKELLRRTSTDSAMGQIELWTNHPADFCVETTRRGSTFGEKEHAPQPQRRRGSTLLHPSPPVMSVENHATTMNVRPISPSFGRKDLFPMRKGSSLLHPSPPLSDTEIGMERGMRNMQLKTVMYVPPRKQWR